MKILWLDDNRVEIRPLEKQIREQFDLLTVVTSVVAAEEAVARGVFDWVILDSSFPALDDTSTSHAGIAFFKQLRLGAYGEWGRVVRVWFYTNWAESVVTLVRGVEPQPERIIAKTPALSSDNWEALSDFLI